MGDNTKSELLLQRINQRLLTDHEISAGLRYKTFHFILSVKNSYSNVEAMTSRWAITLRRHAVLRRIYDTDPDP